MIQSKRQGPPGTPGPAGNAGAFDFMSVDATETFTLAAWQDAGAVGGLTTVERVLLDTDRAVRCTPSKLANGSAATGTRAQGVLLNVDAGDFCHGLRVYLQVPAKAFGATLGDTVEFGAVHVDGADASTADWRGVMVEYTAGGVWPQTPTVYRMESTTGANRWTTFTTFTSLGSPWEYLVELDVWFVRSGTTLTVYACRAGDAPQLVYSWTVSAGAGMVGARFQMYAETAANEYYMGILAHSCGRCGGGLSGVGVMMLATLTSACTAAGMSRLQTSQRTAVAVCAAAQAVEATGEKEVKERARAWCAAAIRLAAAETTAAAQAVEEGIQASEDAGLEVPPGMTQDAGTLAPAGVE